MTSGAPERSNSPVSQVDPGPLAAAGGAVGSSGAPSGGQAGAADPAHAPGTLVLRVSAHAAEAASDEAQALLSPEERERAAAFVRQVDRDRYHVAHVALRRRLAALLDIDPAAVPFTRADCPVCGGPHGRPSVAGDPVHFSLSHAGDLVALAFAYAPVGVDVEEYPALSTVEQTAGALHRREQQEITARPEQERTAAFARCWTRKEAYLKGLGTGLGEDPSISYVSALETPASPDGWRLADLPVPDGYAAATAIRLTRTADGSTP
ncbi:4'-phosphopantetheinyl transferase family protein [Streptomyces cacaoi]|uniref:4'-phosphopantetheinyl transferase domain-containing protein n=1 Tax=Streptomyces cacaoi TaxID=1898 RepID=A0A4Y3R4M1_STRCI|nr:4'-phosphopantetheinyl transferase superfamily protein [Streptomyces cacaoi]NNG85410.1 4'-phosphopantetheinyl transferase superfamily protein [Streptomyces cacaoi]GEB52631.1 hypothetical protein SCA03_51820 [Streptomyces cacaoi]